MNKKLAIVSSYNTVCGNASYTHVLKEALALYYDVEIIAINHKLLSNSHPAATQRRKIYLQELSDKLKQFDCVNIQFEMSLYGHSMGSAYHNLLPLINASRSLLFTIHRVSNPFIGEPIWKTFLRNKTKIWKSLRTISLAITNNNFKHIIDALKAHQNKGNLVSVIVHTPREKELLDLYFDFKDVIDFPITFLNKQQIGACVSNREALRKKVFEKYNFDPNGKYIGIFGFLSENKGHHIAVDALNFLPADYKLAIFGAQHPHAIQEYDLSEGLKKTDLFQRNNNPYISSLVDLAEKLIRKDEQRGISLSPDKQRVRFLGSLDDENFIEAMTAVDFVVVPYFETGQGGSGNASLALELETKVVFSRTFAFMDLARYYPDCFEMTDIGNAYELAQRIYTWNKDLTPAQKKATSRFSIENNALVHREALEKGAQEAEKLKQVLTKK